MSQASILSPDECRNQLRALAPHLASTSDSILDELGSLVGNSPLGIDLIGRYLNQNHTTSPLTYIVNHHIITCQPEFTKLRRAFSLDSVDADPHQINTLACLMLSWRALKGRLAAQVIRVCGYCAPDEAIPMALLVRTFRPNIFFRAGGYIVNRLMRRQRPISNSADLEIPKRLQSAIQQTFALGLLRPAPNSPDTLSVHALVGLFARHQDQTHGSSSLRKMIPAVKALTAVAVESGFPEQCRPWLPHLEFIAQSAEGWNLSDVLWTNLGLMRHAVADYQGAIAAYEKSLVQAKSKYRENHIAFAELMNNLGIVYTELGKFEEAKLRFEQAVHIGENQLGKNHGRVATYLTNLASAIRRLNDLDAAKTMMERALSIHKKSLGENHGLMAVDLNGLGLVLSEMGRYQEAKDYFERALAIGEKAFGSDHPRVSTYVNNLGHVLTNLGRFDEAQTMYEWALRIAEDAYGDHHPKVAMYLNNLGLVLKRLGKVEAAKALYERAMVMDEAVYGVEHIDVARGAINMAVLLCDSGDNKVAKLMFEWGLRILSSVANDRHPLCATAHSGLGILYTNTKDYPVAEQSYLKALDIDTELFGANHPTVAMRHHNLGNLYENMGDLRQSKVHYEVAIRIWEQTLPKDHRDLRSARSGWARVTRRRGEW